MHSQPGLTHSRFQSLGRDSGGWDAHTKAHSNLAIRVSIPRSGFRWLGRSHQGAQQSGHQGFNPSVGIQVVGTPGLPSPSPQAWPVSIPRSGFRWLGPASNWVGVLSRLVSIPRSGFRWLGLGDERGYGDGQPWFQSLGRDSGGWDRTGEPPDDAPGRCFNPSVGIQVVGTSAIRYDSCRAKTFQSLGRDSGGWDTVVVRATGAGSPSFNPSVGIQVVGTSLASPLPA